LLDGSASTGAIFTVEWSQSGGPVQVEILNPTERTASFVVPPVAEVTTITFDFELTSFGGTSGAFARVEVTLLPPETVLLELGTAIGAPGERVSIAATLRTAGEPTTAIEHALAFAPEAAVAALGSSLPSCSVDPAAGASEASFRFAPEGCTPGSDCERVLVAIAADEPLADGVVYRCDVDLTLDDADSCEHALACALPQASGPSGPLALSCVDGKTIADWSVRGVSFAFDVEPPNPTVGEDVAVSVAVAGPGGLPSYRLRGAGPFLEGNTGPINASAFGTVRFDLDAVCPGTANLQLAVDYETLAGCPGMEFFRFTGAVSEVFPIEIVDPETFTLSGMVTEFPLCQGAQRGFTVTLEPLGLTAQTDLSTGGFSFEVPPGDYTLSVSPSCNPFGCWPQTPVSVVDEDVFVQICPEELPTPTVTPTASATPTAIATPTDTPTDTPTAPTETETPSPTASPTDTATPTATDTPRPPTQTATRTPSATFTPTASPTPSTAAVTPTATATPTTQASRSGDGGCSIAGARGDGPDLPSWMMLAAAACLLRRRRRLA
jgi:hypothetical protein